jgi:hypothetical protein
MHIAVWSDRGSGRFGLDKIPATNICSFTMTAGNLTDERLESIERGARERHTLMDRVVLELVEEVRRLRGIIGRIEEE